MTLETATYINQLNTAYPEGGADRSTADDHLRLIKATVKATFPAVTGPVTVTQAELNLVAGATKTLASVSALTVKYSLSISAATADIARISQTVSVLWAKVTSISALNTQYSLSISAVNASISALTTSLNSVSVVLQAAVGSVSAVLNTDLHSVSAVLQASLASVSAALQTNINAISNTVSVMAVRINTLSASVSLVQADVARISQTVSVVIANAAKLSLSVSALNTSVASALDGVGAYALLCHATLNTALVSASVYAGSALGYVTFQFNPADESVDYTSPAINPPGTWQCLAAQASSIGKHATSVFKRVT